MVYNVIDTSIQRALFKTSALALISEEILPMAKKLLYLTVIDGLKERIRNGDFSYNTPFATEEQITTEFGVSRTTAIKALNELENAGLIYRKRRSGSFVTQNCAELVDASSNRLPAKSGQGDGTRIIGIVFPFESVIGGMLHCLKGICSPVNSSGGAVRLYDTEGDPDKETEILRSLLDSDLDGIILSPLYDNRNIEILSRFIANGTPVVLVDKHIENLPISYVVSDNYSGVKALCDCAIENGHTNIGFLATYAMTGMYTLRERYRGYDASFTEHRMQLNLDNVITDFTGKYYDKSSGIPRKEQYHKFLTNAVKQLYESGVTAVMCQNDWTARDTIYACNKLGISVPDQLMVMGFDNVNKYSPIDVADKLITAEQDFYAMGQKAGEIILNEISGKSKEFTKAVIPVKIVKGKNSVKSI